MEDIVHYISGFVCAKLEKRIHCDICCQHLFAEPGTNMPTLFELKNRGPYRNPSRDFKLICVTAEHVLRQYGNKLFMNGIANLLTVKCMGVSFDVLNTELMLKHIKTMDLFNNHKIDLIKSILALYFKERLHFEVRKTAEYDEFIGQKYIKLILFKNQ